MRAAVLHELGATFSIEDVHIDRPEPNEVLIANAAAGVCHSDLHILDGTYPWVVPAVLGHESAGVVEAVGDAVTYVAPGDHVITCVSAFCGECEMCLRGQPALCSSARTTRAPGARPRLSLDGAPVSQFANLASFAEQLLVHERAVVKIPADIPLDRAALVGCGVMTGVGSVFRTARVEPGTTVAVIGCGGIGLNCVQAASIAGALRVIAIDTVAAKLAQAEAFGATDTINARDENPVDAVRALTGGGVQYSFEAIGRKDTVEQAFAMLRSGGTTTVIGMVPLGVNIEVPAVDFLAEKRIQGCLMGSNRFRTDMPLILELYRQGRLKLDELVSSRMALDQINDACEALRGGETMRNVIVFDRP